VRFSTPGTEFIWPPVNNGQSQPSHSYQLRSRVCRLHPSSDLDVVGRSKAPLVGPQSYVHENLPGPETSVPCRSFCNSPPVEISSSPMYDEEVETMGHWIASPLGSSSSESMPILSPTSDAGKIGSFSHLTTDITPEMPYLRPEIVISTALLASSSLSGTATSDSSSLGPLPEREDLLHQTLQISQSNVNRFQ